MRGQAAQGRCHACSCVRCFFDCPCAQTIGGAVSTGTHGSSLKWGSLSNQVVELHTVLANGTTRIFSDATEPFLMKVKVHAFRVHHIISQRIMMPVSILDGQDTCTCMMTCCAGKLSVHADAAATSAPACVHTVMCRLPCTCTIYSHACIHAHAPAPRCTQALRVAQGQLAVITHVRLRITREIPVHRTLTRLSASQFVQLLRGAQVYIHNIHNTL